MKNKVLIVLLLVLSFMPTKSFSQNLLDYLILQDLGVYKLETPEKVVGGYIGGPRVFEGAGPIAPTGHFHLDHLDRTYEVYYQGGKDFASPKVQVTQHAGSESDKWLLHELDTDFRNYYGIPGRSYEPREIEGQTVLEDAVAGADYRWVSGNKLIMIKYRDSEMTKPEPIEVVKAYLAKHPSTLPPLKLAQLRSSEMKTIWIKDEMERRLWLCDKWFLQLQMSKVQENETLQTVVKYLVIFLDYRQKYYGISAQNEEIALAGYLRAKDGTSIKNKLTEYKTWWSVNRTKAINLP